MQHIAEGAGTDGLERIGRRARAPTLQAAWFCVIAMTRCNNKPQSAFLLHSPMFWEIILCNRGSIGEDTVVITAHCSFKCGPTKESHHFFIMKIHIIFVTVTLEVTIFVLSIPFVSEYSPSLPAFVSCARLSSVSTVKLKWVAVSECTFEYFWEQMLQKASRLSLWIFRCVWKDQGRG